MLCDIASATWQVHATTRDLYVVQSIIAVLNKLSKVALPPEIVRFIHDSTANYGKVHRLFRTYLG